MAYLSDILSNRAFGACLLAWFLAQGAKVIIHRITDKEWNFNRFFQLGGMPSSHSAITSGVAISTGIMRGFGSLEFTITLVFALVVMTDAAGVRREAGQHARLINEILKDMIDNGRGLTPEKLKELLGHSPFEVAVGALLGVLVAIAAI